MSRQYASRIPVRETVHQNNGVRAKEKKFFGGKQHVDHKTQWAAMRALAEYLRDREIEKAVEPRIEQCSPPAVAQRQATTEFTPEDHGRTLDQYLGAGQEFIETGSGQMVDLRHVTDFRNRTGATLQQMWRQLRNIRNVPETIVADFETQMEQAGLRVRFQMRFRLNTAARSLTSLSHPGSNEMQSAIRDVMLYASYMTELIQAGLPLEAGEGSAFQEEDLKSNYLGIEIGARAARIRAHNPTMSEADALRSAQQEVLREFEPRRFHGGYEPDRSRKSLDYRIQGHDSFYSGHVPSVRGILLETWSVAGQIRGAGDRWIPISRAWNHSNRADFMKKYREILIESVIGKQSTKQST